MKTDMFATPDQNISVYNTLQLRESADKPIRVGVVGAGATGRAIALQLGTPLPGIRLAGISNRTTANTERAHCGRPAFQAGSQWILRLKLRVLYRAVRLLLQIILRFS